ncbi:hypothetical protein [Burkholderia sp. HI2500]|uniref:hypothetical protein n=1 Tax=Burkholderia sp. HI2500 TaxID=2015358 RepID=UPI00118120D6|nr:hypothetical protein [Burkholderia sp. HI2500]
MTGLLNRHEARQWADRLRSAMADGPLSDQLVDLLAFLDGIENDHPVARKGVQLRIAGCVGARRQSLAGSFV